MPNLIPERETMEVEFKSDLKKLSDSDLVDFLAEGCVCCHPCKKFGCGIFCFTMKNTPMRNASEFFHCPLFPRSWAILAQCSSSRAARRRNTDPNSESTVRAVYSVTVRRAR